MKVMITWEMHPGKLHETLAAFTEMSPEQEANMMGPDITLIGRWHDVVRGTGVVVYETDSVEAVSNYAMAWNAHMDMDLSIVLDDDEVRALGRKQSR